MELKQWIHTQSIIKIHLSPGGLEPLEQHMSKLFKQQAGGNAILPIHLLTIYLYPKENFLFNNQNASQSHRSLQMLSLSFKSEVPAYTCSYFKANYLKAPITSWSLTLDLLLEFSGKERAEHSQAKSYPSVPQPL